MPVGNEAEYLPEIWLVTKMCDQFGILVLFGSKKGESLPKIAVEIQLARLPILGCFVLG